MPPIITLILISIWIKYHNEIINYFKAKKEYYAAQTEHLKNEKKR